MTRPVLRRPEDDNDGLVALPPITVVRQRLRTTVKEFATAAPGRRAAALAAVWIAATATRNTMIQMLEHLEELEAAAVAPRPARRRRRR